MASSKPRASSAAVPPEESSIVQVLDSNEPLVASSSSGIPRVQVVDSSEPLVCEPLCVQVIDSSEPLVCEPPCVQVMDSSEPLVPDNPSASLSESSPLPSEPDSSDDTLDLSDVPLPGTLSSDSDNGLPQAAGPSQAAGSSQAAGTSCDRPRLSSVELRSQWNFAKVLHRLGTKEDCIKFAEEQGLLPTSKKCRKHKSNMSLKMTANVGQFGQFRCQKISCKGKTVSRAKGTWFEYGHLAVTTIFQIMYMYIYQFTFEMAQRELAGVNGTTVLSHRTIDDWYSYCREVIIIYFLEKNNSETKIGGPGKIVQIDESKFGKRKYNRGRAIDGHWVLGMIEDKSDDLRLEVCPDNDRSAEILVPLIQKHVEEGSIIHTDYWRAYDCLPQYGYIHMKVNHSDKVNKFVAPDGVHTQRIESHWRHLKIKYKKEQFKGTFADWLVEYEWRRKIRLQKLDPYDELIKAIQFVYKIK